MTVMDKLLEAITLSYENFEPNMEKNQWTIMQLETLLDNLLLDNNDLRQYYLNFIDIVRSM